MDIRNIPSIYGLIVDIIVFVASYRLTQNRIDVFRSMKAKNVESRCGLSKSLVLLLVFSKVSATHMNTSILKCQAIYERNGYIRIALHV
jgi:hypothetical protein